MDASRVCRGRRMLRKIRWMFASAGLGGNVFWRCGSTIPDGSSGECDLWLRRWPSWTVPALTAAECCLGYNHRYVECPASGPRTPQSTAHRNAAPHRSLTWQSETQPPRRGRPLCPPARIALRAHPVNTNKSPALTGVPACPHMSTLAKPHYADGGCKCR